MRSGSLKKHLRSDEVEAWSRYCIRTGIRGQWGDRRATWEGVAKGGGGLRKGGGGKGGRGGGDGGGGLAKNVLYVK